MAGLVRAKSDMASCIWRIAGLSPATDFRIKFKLQSVTAGKGRPAVNSMLCWVMVGYSRMTTTCEKTVYNKPDNMPRKATHQKPLKRKK